MKILMRILGVLVLVGSIGIAGYVGIWEMFCEPIINACQHFDAGTLTGTIIAVTILKCAFASTVSGLILAIFPSMGLAMITSTLD